jgi:hypothetical protein
MAKEWKRVARGEVLRSQLDPDYRPRYRVPARRWWQLWKPKWDWVEGVSQNQIRRAYDYPEARYAPLTFESALLYLGYPDGWEAAR